MLDERVNNGLSIFFAHRREHHVARLAFDEGRDLAVLAAKQQVAFPVPRKRPVFDCGRPLPDRYRIPDLPVDARL